MKELPEKIYDGKKSDPNDIVIVGWASQIAKAVNKIIECTDELQKRSLLKPTEAEALKIMQKEIGQADGCGITGKLENKPTRGSYFMINTRGSVVEAPKIGMKYKERKKFGNCFKTRRLAVLALQEIQIVFNNLDLLGVKEVKRSVKR
jgi:hypothetical protein